ncbi:MAG: hypothetical protein GY711_19700 [bacterium]|nr:hypothetical protein [bacterium]
MTRTRLENTRLLMFGSAVLGAITALTPAAVAQTSTVTYDLDDVWLLPDISHPGAAAQPMSLSFEWTYVPGDFENGSGLLLDGDIPWWGLGLVVVDATIETSAIELTLAGNYHDLGLDITIKFLQPLSVDQSSTIDTVLSSFEIEVGITRRGHIVSGSAVPRALYSDYCGPAAASSTGAPGELRAFGTSSVQDNDLTLEATSLPANQFGYFLASRTRAFVQNPGGSQGNLCLGGSILRFTRPGEIGFSGPAGEFSLGLDLTSFPSSPPSPVLPGEEWNFQAWFRDQNPAATSNFTQGITVEFE